MFSTNLQRAIILGTIKGIIEQLPISSTGHLILVDEFIKLNLSKGFMEMFSVIIQPGAIIAVVVLCFHKLNPFSLKENDEEKRNIWILWSKVLVACLPMAVIGLKFDDYSNAHFCSFLTVSVMLTVYGIAFIIIEERNRNVTPKCTNLKDSTHKAALIVGASQVLALIPGTLRLGATILGAVLIRVSRFAAAEFSFFSGVPIMFGASFLRIFKFLAKENAFGSEEVIVLSIGSIVAFAVSIIMIKFSLNCLKESDLTVFGWYRVILGTTLTGCWLFSQK